MLRNARGQPRLAARSHHDCLNVPEIRLYPEHWGKGVMSAALRLWLPLTYRTTDLHRLLAVVEEPNLPSARLLERAGFHYEGTARECEHKGAGFISLRHYAILRSDLPARR